MDTPPRASQWFLEIVRGRDVGRRYPLSTAATLLGNALGGAGGIDLAEQEGGSPRRMAGRHARLDRSVDGTGLTIRDLGSPGGTFVNRGRLGPNTPQPLRDGDVIQLAGVQIRLVAGKPPLSVSTEPPPTRPHPPSPPTAHAATSSVFFQLASGAVCRSWDDFLVVSAQRWGDLREELLSGRLASYLGSIGRTALAPDLDAKGSPDERLDAWLASLPTTRPNAPELDVYPTQIELRVAPGGGTIHRSVQVSNVGHRLLRVSARIEPRATTWLAIAPEWPAEPVAVLDRIDLPLRIEVPATLEGLQPAYITFEGNGGTRRVAITLVRAIATGDLMTGGVGSDGQPARAENPLIPLASRSPLQRIGVVIVVAMLARLMLGVTGMMIGDGAGSPVPGLIGPAIGTGVVGILAGAFLALRRKPIMDLFTSAGAGGVLGLFAASLGVAISQVIETPLGTMLKGSLVGAIGLWGLLGAAIAGLSLAAAPFQPRQIESRQ